MNLVDRDLKVMWHPYTQMRDWNKQTKIVITRGDGFYLIDQNGKRYLDGIASMWCNVWGHGKNEIVKTMVKQLHTIQHSTLFGLSSSASIELAESLLKIAKGMHHEQRQTHNGKENMPVEGSVELTEATST